MILPFALSFGLSAPLQILFVGNSHTEINNVPNMVRQLLLSDLEQRQVYVRYIPVSLLEDSSPEVAKAIESQKWDVVVLQGAKVSSSHKYRYRQDKAISLARLALSRKARVYLCAEWPRRGWDESDYQLGVYRDIQTAAPGSVIIPICKVWDASRKGLNGIDLWAPDGNHANLKGSYLSALSIHRFVANSRLTVPTWIPGGVSRQEAAIFQKNALDAYLSQDSKNRTNG